MKGLCVAIAELPCWGYGGAFMLGVWSYQHLLTRAIY